MTLALGRRAPQALWAAAFVFIAALITAAAILALSMRSTALDEVQAQLNRYVSGTEASLNRTILNVDVLLASSVSAISPSDQEARNGQGRSPADLSAVLARNARLNLAVRTLAVVNGQGAVVASSDPRGAAIQLQLPEGFLDRALGSMISTAVVSAPTPSLASSEEVVYFARHLRGDANERWVAVAEMPVAALSEVLQQGAQIPGLEAVLETGGGHVLLRVPDTGGAPPSARVLPLRDAAIPISPVLPEHNSAWDGTTRVTGVPGSVVARPIIFDDLWVSGSVPRSVALEGWRADATAVAVVTAVFTVLGLLATFLFTQYLRRIGHAKRALAKSKAQLDQALEAMISGFVLLDRERRVLHWNQRFDQLFPWLHGLMRPLVPFGEVLIASAVHELPAASDAQRREWVQKRLLTHQDDVGTLEQQMRDGRTIRIVEHGVPEGGMVITYQDVTDMRRASAEIETLAFYDPLTGLPNRRLLVDRLSQSITRSQRSGELGALLFLDLDQFKTLNDTMGHEMGDALLLQVAQRLREGVRSADTVARLGGDEFVIMLTDLSSERIDAAERARRVAEKLLVSLEQPYQLGSHQHQGTGSLGATLFGTEPVSAAELLRQADIAMYQVKARRGNGLCFFDPQMQTTISNRAQLQADLKLALGQNEFVLFYQPQWSQDGAMIGAEVLLRWQHRDRGLLAPGAFIAVAEESDLIVAIGEWVLCSACQQLAAWKEDAQCGTLQVSVNVSARQFRHPRFVDSVLDAVACVGSRAHLLTLELTESMVLDNVDETVARMHLLRARGIRFSVDDFGTGYSSLAYLTQLPLHQLKIDQSFVRNLGSRPTDEVIVQTIIGMATNLDLEVIAEGVETEEQRQQLLHYGCHFFQGYLLGRPMPVEALCALQRVDGPQAQ